MKNFKYLFNTNTGMLHILGGCACSKKYSDKDTSKKVYKTEDECIKENKKYFRKCKNCFKEQ